MPRFGKTSSERLATCHPDIVKIMNVAIVDGPDFSIACGRRGKKEQDYAVAMGYSKVRFPDSKHNAKPLSLAVDVAPYPVDWDDLKRFHVLAGYIMAIAQMLYDDDEISHLLRWGGDWDRDWCYTDQKWHDLPHFELYDPKGV